MTAEPSNERGISVDFRQMAQFRYRSPKIPDGTTHRALEWLGAEKQIDVIIKWVEDNFEPRPSGPTLLDEEDLPDIADAIFFEFEDVIPSRVIENAIYSLPHYNWVPKYPEKLGRPKRRNRRPIRPNPRFGTFAEAVARKELLAHLDRLDAAISAYREALGPIGHNRPPGVIELDEEVPPPVQHIEHASAVLRAEMSQENPSLDVTRDAARKIRVWGKVWEWFKQKADRAVNSFVDKTGTIAAVAIAAGLFGCGDTLARCALEVDSAASKWISTTTQVEPQHEITTDQIPLRATEKPPNNYKRPK